MLPPPVFLATSPPHMAASHIPKERELQRKLGFSQEGWGLPGQAEFQGISFSQALEVTAQSEEPSKSAVCPWKG